MKRRPKGRPRRKRFSGPIHGRIKELREDNELTQEQLAEALGVDNTLVSHWETGLARPTVEMLGPLADAFGVSVGELIEGEKRYAAVLSLMEAA